MTKSPGLVDYKVSKFVLMALYNEFWFVSFIISSSMFYLLELIFLRTHLIQKKSFA